MIISGNKIARAIRKELNEYTGKVSNRISQLHIFIVGDNPVIENFVMKKQDFAREIGVKFIEHRFKDGVSQEDLMNAIYTTADDVQQKNGMVGMVVQLPLPSNINTKMVLDSVPARFDIDGLSTGTLFTAPVAGAVEEIFNRKNINPAGKKVLVVGSGKLVGEPVRSLLVSLGADVVMVDNSTDITELTKLSKRAYIIVSGTGVPGLIQPNMISNECVLIDAGTSTQNGGVVGDIAYECKEKAKYFARTPGGVGPVTVAVLFKNLILGNNIIK